ncbi:transposase [Dictyobacter alpinus]|uniref:Transposase n=1 Tax=Dictyobacter alpinus TaxID=2014873 RepID=A0A402BD61_9CHLR|nr:TnsA endonuclease N-terminal domain-containing protein [Dictyobacter alpinus]GCE29333.1 transposase [Dictyobacter alpinus]
MKTRMDQAQFQHYCRELHFTEETQDLLARLRHSPPVRRVQGRRGNVSGFFPSRKMGVAIQFESSLELSAIYLMEQDDAVLEFYDQPHTFKLKYLDKAGKKLQGHFYTPDFLVLRKNGVFLEEWKMEEDLHQLATKQPYRYQRNVEGLWLCPPGDELTQPLGFSFRVCSSALLPRTYVDNLDFLTDYFISQPVIPQRLTILVRERVQAEPGITIGVLVSEVAGLRPHDLYALIAQEQIFADLYRCLLRDHYRTPLFADQPTALAYAQLGMPASPGTGSIAEPVTAPIATNTRLLWDGRIWTLVNLGETTTTLLPEYGEPIQLSSAFFLRLLEARTIIIPKGERDPQVPTEVQERMAAASKADFRIANERFRWVSVYLEGDKEQVRQAPVSQRTVRRWAQAYQAAVLSYRTGYVGLLPKTSQRGNRHAKAPEEAQAFLLSFITESYETPREAPAWEVYLAYQRACEEKQVVVLSSRTFYRQIKQREGFAQTKARQGAKAAYAQEPWILELTSTTPRHGNRPFAIVHLDHTELDVMLVSSVTGKPLGKPWVTFLVDAFSRRILSAYLTFDPPSYRSAMMALRICVQRFGRMPGALVVDGGREFHSTYFDALLLRYHTAKKDRPGSKPRFGSVIERLFGTTNTEFVHNLLGNTQAAKRPRQLTKEVDPRKQAVWHLADLYAFLCEWAYEVYDQMDHPALFQSPRDAFVQGLVQTGEREQRAIPYADEFLMASSPSTRKGTAKVERGRGIKIHGIYYSTLQLRSSEVEGTQVEVRYDPFNIGIAYAYVKTTWVRCVSQYHTFLQGHSEKELMLASKEIRRQNQLHTKNRTVTARRLADFLSQASEHEAIRQQRIRDLEAKAILEAIAGTVGQAGVETVSIPLTTSHVSQDQAKPVDFASLTAFEEFE